MIWLTGLVYNESHKLVGLNMAGFSVGAEIKPTDKSYVRIEHRYLETMNNEKLFRYNGSNTTQRLEWLISTGFWF